MQDSDFTHPPVEQTFPPTANLFFLAVHLFSGLGRKADRLLLPEGVPFTLRYFTVSGIAMSYIAMSRSGISRFRVIGISPR
ncbi:hypothetical protein C7B76_26645 [filamentous cyanobacterium CCP2]|nr:hypothetical protein C7B76_26645 [filamentous cyanobacterium CCP2]